MLMNPADTAVFGQIALVVVTSVGALTAIGVAAHRFVERTNLRVQQLVQPQIAPSDERLQRLEQAVESIAIEVERISEGQRFLTKLQTEQRIEGRALER
jgi:signal transduction protein with GAF and PtsI domain